MSTTAGFVPIRLDAVDLLGRPAGRRDGHGLAALGVAVALAERVDWRTDELTPFRSVAFAEQHRMPWRRLRRALDQLAACGVGHADLHLFHPGRVTLTPRASRSSLLHDRARTHERFVALARGSLAAIADEHHLSWTATSLLVLLLLLCDHRTAELPDGWTKTRLCDHVGVGWRRLSAALAELNHAGLVTCQTHRGRPMALTLLARPALVALTAATPPKRHDRRRIRSEARHRTGPAADVARRLVDHHHLAVPPSAALTHALADLLATGAAARTVLERLAARGTLAEVRDPMAVLVARVRHLADELDAARDADNQRRRRQAERRASEARDDSERTRRHQQVDAESRWLAGILRQLPDGAQLGLSPLVATRAAPVAAHIHAACAALVARWADLDPAELVARWAQHPCPPDQLDTTGVAPRADTHSPPGTLPRARAGPTLADRLRSTRV